MFSQQSAAFQPLNEQERNLVQRLLDAEVESPESKTIVDYYLLDPEKGMDNIYTAPVKIHLFTEAEAEILKTLLNQRGIEVKFFDDERFGRIVQSSLEFKKNINLVKADLCVLLGKPNEEKEKYIAPEKNRLINDLILTLETPNALYAKDNAVILMTGYWGKEANRPKNIPKLSSRETVNVWFNTLGGEKGVEDKTPPGTIIYSGTINIKYFLKFNDKKPSELLQEIKNKAITDFENQLFINNEAYTHLMALIDQHILMLETKPSALDQLESAPQTFVSKPESKESHEEIESNFNANGALKFSNTNNNFKECLSTSQFFLKIMEDGIKASMASNPFAIASLSVERKSFVENNFKENFLKKHQNLIAKKLDAIFDSLQKSCAQGTPAESEIEKWAISYKMHACARDAIIYYAAHVDGKNVSGCRQYVEEELKKHSFSISPDKLDAIFDECPYVNAALGSCAGEFREKNSLQDIFDNAIATLELPFSFSGEDLILDSIITDLAVEAITVGGRDAFVSIKLSSQTSATNTNQQSSIFNRFP